VTSPPTDDAGPVPPEDVQPTITRRATSRFVKRWFQVVSFFLSVAVAIIYYLQLDAMHAAMRADQRAWLGPVELGQLDLSLANLPIPLKNFGKTPALGVKNDVNGTSLPKDHVLMPRDIWYKKQVEGPVETVIYPGEQRDQVLNIDGPENELKAFNAGDHIMVSLGIRHISGCVWQGAQHALVSVLFGHTKEVQ
jgi:hypothetical protein